MIAEMLHSIFYVFPLWLVGYWWCSDCTKRYGLKDEKVSMQHADICRECYARNWGIVLEEVQDDSVEKV
jgi:hypothetical protein